MRQTQFRQVVILSAELSSLTAQENSIRTSNLEECLKDLSITNNKGQGVYRGSSEDCFVCLPKDLTEYYTLKQLALRSFGQECILVQGTNGESSLVYNDDTIEQIGKLRKTTKIKAMKENSYTILNNNYYTVSA
jgi:hypothetical protein